MKKRTKQLVCSALVGMVSISSVSAMYLTPQAAESYSKMDNQWHNTYGHGDLGWWGSDGRKISEGPAFGHPMSKLIDLDCDGTPELYCCASESLVYPDHSVPYNVVYIQKMYAYDGKLYELTIPKRPSNFENTEKTVVTKFMVGTNHSYLVCGQDTANGGEVSYVTKQGHSMVTAFRYTDYVAADGIRHCTVNGKSVSKAELDAQIADFEKDLYEVSYTYWAEDENDNHAFDTFWAKNQCYEILRGFEIPRTTAPVSKHRVVLDNSPVTLGAYTIDSRNYFKLRDLAYILSGTKAQFNVTWNEAERRIDLTDGQAYTPVGGEGAALKAGSSKPASFQTSTVYLDGKPIDLISFNIGGNNYVQLRDVSRYLDFSVDWDSATSSILIDSNKTYY